MQPTSTHYFYAENWPARIWLAVTTVSAGVGAVWLCEPTTVALSDWAFVLLLPVVLAIALATGYFMGILFGTVVIGPLYYHRAVENGAPFKEGDRVMILVGPHRNRVTRVYSLWQHDSVRVELGDKEMPDFSDVFGPTQLLLQGRRESL